MPEHPEIGLKTYWTTWGLLLGLTLVMIVLDQTPMTRQLFILLMLAAMLVKATLIAGTFMHLRAEHAALVWMVLVGLFATGAVLYGLILPDAFRILGMHPW
jgi:cytochrome c oxidase subunit IV